MAEGGSKGVRRLIRATGYSVAGFRACFRHEEAFRQEVVLAIILIPLGLWLGESGADRALLLAAVLLVPLVELLNSAVEAAVDRMGPEHHELSGRAKDIGSAAVFLAIVIAAAVWLLVLI